MSNQSFFIHTKKQLEETAKVLKLKSSIFRKLEKPDRIIKFEIPVQMITLAVVSMFYIPCIATIAALAKEFGWKRALAISGFEILFAIGIGGLISRLLIAIW